MLESAPRGGLLPGGYAPGGTGGYPCPGGFSLPVGGLLPGRRGFSLAGGGVVWSRGFSLAGGVLPTGDPPVHRMTDRCKNITLATTSLRPVIIKPFT